MVGGALDWSTIPSNVETYNIYDTYSFYRFACSIQLGPYTIVTGGEYTHADVSKYNLKVREDFNKK